MKLNRRNKTGKNDKKITNAISKDTQRLKNRYFYKVDKYQKEIIPPLAL